MRRVLRFERVKDQAGEYLGGEAPRGVKGGEDCVVGNSDGYVGGFEEALARCVHVAVGTLRQEDLCEGGYGGGPLDLLGFRVRVEDRVAYRKGGNSWQFCVAILVLLPRNNLLHKYVFFFSEP